MVAIPSISVRNIKRAALFAGPALAGVIYLAMMSNGIPHKPSFVAAVAFFCAVWWVFEAIPIPLTALVPLAAFPLFSILSVEDIAQSFGHQIIFLIMGGFMLSAALVQNGTHRNIALSIVNIIGVRSGARIVIGFTLVAALLSMWISNAATAIMLVPVAIAVIEKDKTRALVIPLLLAICYGASVGGIGTPIGSPTNLIFFQAYGDATGEMISFVEWMKIAFLPMAAMLALVCYHLARRAPKRVHFDVHVAGPWTKPQLATVFVFGVTAFLWLTRADPFGGWSTALNLSAASDGMVALMAVVALAVIPDGEGGKLLAWETAKAIPWDVLLLLAAAIALSKAFASSGLSVMMADQFSGLAGLPTIALILSVCLLITFTTELVSNTATAAIFMPILASVAEATDVDAALLMAPAVMCASCAFMMPFATGPNAIVFGSGRVSLMTMARHGFALNLASAPIVAGLCYITLR